MIILFRIEIRTAVVSGLMILLCLAGAPSLKAAALPQRVQPMPSHHPEKFHPAPPKNQEIFAPTDTAIHIPLSELQETYSDTARTTEKKGWEPFCISAAPFALTKTILTILVIAGTLAYEAVRWYIFAIRIAGTILAVIGLSRFNKPGMNKKGKWLAIAALILLQFSGLMITVSLIINGTFSFPLDLLF